MSNITFKNALKQTECEEIETFLNIDVGEFGEKPGLTDFEFELEVEFKYYPSYAQTWDDPGETDEIEVQETKLIYLGELELTEEQKEFIANTILSARWDDIEKQINEYIQAEDQENELEFLSHKRSSLDDLI